MTVLKKNSEVYLGVGHDIDSTKAVKCVFKK